MRILGYVFVVLIILFGMTFATLNSESVIVSYYFGKSEVALSLLLVIVFTLGSVTGIGASLWIIFRTKLQNHRLRSRLELIEREIEHIRDIEHDIPVHGGL